MVFLYSKILKQKTFFYAERQMFDSNFGKTTFEYINAVFRNGWLVSSALVGNY